MTVEEVCTLSVLAGGLSLKQLLRVEDIEANLLPGFDGGGNNELGGGVREKSRVVEREQSRLVEREQSRVVERE
jgi:hypothetical protein